MNSTGMRYQFPPQTVIPSNTYFLAVKSKKHIQSAYSNLDPSMIFGDYEGLLPSSDAFITLLNPSNVVQLNVQYKDGWQRSTDGFGPSLELACVTADPNLSKNWRASPLPGTLTLHTCIENVHCSSQEFSLKVVLFN
jgi:hypothetical protein